MRIVALAAAGCSLFLVSGCKGCGNGSTDTGTDTGQCLVGCTDALPGDSGGGSTDSGDGGGPGSDSNVPPSAACAPLPPPSGATITVAPADADTLPGVVAGAATGTTILLMDGTYTMTGSSESERRIQFATPGITLRSASGDRDAVVIDGEYVTNEIITIFANDVTIADVTITRAVDHPIHAYGAPGNVTGVVLHNLHIIDGGEQFVKVNSDGSGNFVDDGVLECSLFEMTPAGRAFVETTNPGQCYTGGIDAHGAWGWTIRDNVFRDIYCTNGFLAEHAIHFWTGSRDTLTERNLITECGRGIGYGLVETGAGRTYPDDPYAGIGYIGHYDGIIRNNVIYASVGEFDTGIELDQARGTLVHHNTIVHSAVGYSSIDYRFANTLVTIRNNLVRVITVRDGAAGTVEYNLETTDVSLFTSVGAFDFHLVAGAAAAIDQGTPIPEAGLDIDGEAHDNGAPDLGADELW